MASTLYTTERLYFKDSYESQAQVNILASGTDETGPYVIFDKTLFHPQGGGQPSDEGSFSIHNIKFTVTKLVEEKGNLAPIKHYYQSEQEASDLIKEGEVANQEINLEKRKLFARLHSAGHLFANIVNSLYPEIDGTRGNHFPNQSFVVLSKENGKVENLTPQQKEEILAKILEIINQDIPVEILFDVDGNRSIKIGNFKEFPCGGTHVTKTSEIGTFVIRSTKREKNDIKIGYNVE